MVAATRTARLTRTSHGLAFVAVRRPHRQPSIAPALVGAHGLDLAAARVALSTTCVLFKLSFRVLFFVLLAPAECLALAPALGFTCMMPVGALYARPPPAHLLVALGFRGVQKSPSQALLEGGFNRPDLHHPRRDCVLRQG